MSCLFDSVKKMNWFSDCFLLTLVLQPNGWMSRTLAIFRCLIYERPERKEKHQTQQYPLSTFMVQHLATTISYKNRQENN